MKESGRLTARETTELEHRLLEAARKARMPDELASRMRHGLGFGAKAAGAGAAALSLKVGGAVVARDGRDHRRGGHDRWLVRCRRRRRRRDGAGNPSPFEKYRMLARGV